MPRWLPSTPSPPPPLAQPLVDATTLFTPTFLSRHTHYTPSSLGARASPTLSHTSPRVTVPGKILENPGGAAPDTGGGHWRAKMFIKPPPHPHPHPELAIKNRRACIITPVRALSRAFLPPTPPPSIMRFYRDLGLRKFRGESGFKATNLGGWELFFDKELFIFERLGCEWLSGVSTRAGGEPKLTNGVSLEF